MLSASTPYVVTAVFLITPFTLCYMFRCVLSLRHTYISWCSHSYPVLLLTVLTNKVWRR